MNEKVGALKRIALSSNKCGLNSQPKFAKTKTLGKPARGVLSPAAPGDLFVRSDLRTVRDFDRGPGGSARRCPSVPSTGDRSRSHGRRGQSDVLVRPHRKQTS